MNKTSIDILNTLSNLSSDEVFTPPEIVNKMLDMLPQELFESETTTFLDPCTKSGVFLREIVKRLNKGLENKIPNLQERINHILSKQIYGIATTELCHFMSKRTLYCSKFANDKYSIGEKDFKNNDGNVLYIQCNHIFNSEGVCKICGISEKVLKQRQSDENYAYSFIHEDVETIKRRYNGMRFDVIIGNPPYQMDDGGAQASAKPIYNLFIDQALKLNPRYASFIIPSRWFTGGKGLNDFRDRMIHSNHFIKLVDFFNASECFQNVEIKGGVCYFLYSQDYTGKCQIETHVSQNKIIKSNRYLSENEKSEIFIRDPRLITLRNKIWLKATRSFSSIVSSFKPYGLRGDVFSNTSKYGLPSMFDKPFTNSIEIVGLINNKRIKKYVGSAYPFPKQGLLNEYKVFLARNWGSGKSSDVPSDPILASPEMACTETFVEIGPFKNSHECENVINFIKTKFFRVMVSIKKFDQSASKSVYEYVPLLDFSEYWNDEKIYKYFDLTQEEIEIIDDIIG